MTYPHKCLTDVIRKKIEQFSRIEGRRLRMLISSMGPQKLDEKTLKVAKSLAELGLDIDIGPNHPSVFFCPSSSIRSTIANIICAFSYTSFTAAIINFVQSSDWL
jgi:hypothetical protein